MPARRVSQSVLVAAATMILGACPSPFAEQVARPQTSKDLAFKATPAPPQAAGGSTDDGAEAAESEGDAETPAPGTNPGQPRPIGTPATVGPEQRFEVIGAFRDPRGDTSSASPGYADLVSVSLEDDGGETLRVSVLVAGHVPDRLGPEEVVGIGVDLSMGAGDYQFFASGEPGGWFGYFHTPGGFVRYPGDFSISGRVLTFTAPWDALGGRGAGRASAFADHTGSRSYSEDRAPDTGAVPFGD